ncbi:MAG TPA: hypothetical protein VFJ16_26785 [Longimicrobium sp.]|nr:hypothetical protein [Longimicrobium sp.]
MRTPILATLLVLAGAAAPRPARGQSVEDAALRGAALKAAYLREMTAVGEPFTGRLAATASARWRVVLQAGRSYALAGRCDAGCHDLDLRLLGPDGAEVSADVELDAEPLVRVVPRQSGSYELRAYMADCRQPACTFVVRLMAR